MPKRLPSPRIVGGGLVVFLIASAIGIGAVQLTGQTVPIDSDDIGGVVTGPRGPRRASGSSPKRAIFPPGSSESSSPTTAADTWSPIFRKPRTTCGSAAMGWSIQPRSRRHLAGSLNLTAVAAPNARAAAEYYPASYWYSLAQPPAKSEFPGTGATRQRHRRDHEEPGGLARRDAMRRLPPNRQQADPRVPEEPRHVRFVGGGLGTAPAIGTDWRQHERHSRPVRPRARARHVRRLDRSHRRRRSAPGPAPTAGCRAQRGRELVGLEHGQGLRARHDFHRQAQSDAQPERPRLQHLPVQRAGDEHPGPGTPHGDRHHASRSATRTRPSRPRSRWRSPRRTGERKSSGRASPACTTR